MPNALPIQSFQIELARHPYSQTKLIRSLINSVFIKSIFLSPLFHISLSEQLTKSS